MFSTCLNQVRQSAPLVHNITNYVTVNDVANALLACGGSPIMADDPQDVEDITSICGGLNINIGTLNSRTVESMLLAGKKAQELGHALLLDPVGAGASRMRTETALKLMDTLNFNVMDADAADAVTEENLDTVVGFVKDFAKKAGSIIAITGAIDLVSDGEKCYVIRNGRPEMSRITGTGCQLSGVLTAYLVANPDNQLEAAAAAVASMGLAGEIGWSNMQEGDGNSTYRNRIIDALYNMTGDLLERGAKYEIR